MLTNNSFESCGNLLCNDQQAYCSPRLYLFLSKNREGSLKKGPSEK